jgi:hypothetical protein
MIMGMGLISSAVGESQMKHIFHSCMISLFLSYPQFATFSQDLAIKQAEWFMDQEPRTMYDFCLYLESSAGTGGELPFFDKVDMELIIDKDIMTPR